MYKNYEEALAAAKKAGFKGTDEEFKAEWNKQTASGEMSDADLDKVSGGSTTIDIGGVHYVVVTCANSCPVNKFLLAADPDDWYGSMWWHLSAKGQCGCCANLRFDGAIGYCSKRAANNF